MQPDCNDGGPASAVNRLAFVTQKQTSMHKAVEIFRP